MADNDFNPIHYAEQLEQASEFYREQHPELPDVSATYRKSAEVIRSLVRHGRWIEASDGDGVVCSECGTDFCTLLYRREDLKYCICGAKMDGGTEDGTNQ